MTMTSQDRLWMGKREELTGRETTVVCILFDQLYKQSNWHNVKAAGDDRAASLEAALVRFFIKSREA
jgi:hypothetical protein